MRVTELAGEQAAKVVRDWDYPREVDDAEIVNSKWFSYGDGCVWWLNRNQYHEGRELSLHICIEPGQRNRIFGRKLLYAIEIVGELMHAERLVSWMPADSLVQDYLARMGWKVLPDRPGPEGCVAWALELDGTGAGWRY